MTLKMLLNFQTRAWNPLRSFFPRLEAILWQSREGERNSLSCYRSLQRGRGQPVLVEIQEGLFSRAASPNQRSWGCWRAGVDTLTSYTRTNRWSFQNASQKQVGGGRDAGRGSRSCWNCRRIPTPTDDWELSTLWRGRWRSQTSGGAFCTAWVWLPSSEAEVWE